MTDEYRAYLDSKKATDSDHQDIPHWKPSGKNEESPDSIEHSGIKGMHWHVRRWQNPDGSLTPAGVIRYRKEATDKKPSNDSSEEDTKPKKEKYNSKTLTYRAKAQTLTDDELARRNKRMQLEAQYNQLRSQIQPKSKTEKRKEMFRTIFLASATTAATAVVGMIWKKAFTKTFDALTAHKFDLTGEVARAARAAKAAKAAK